MRIRQRYSRLYYGRANSGGEDGPVWGAAQAFYAHALPAGDRQDEWLSTRETGERAQSALLLYARREPPVFVGDGVCVDVSSDQPCDYRVTARTKCSTHYTLRIERIGGALR